VKAAALDGSSWLSHTPAETQAYTTAIMTKMNAGAGAPAPPAWGDVEQSILKTVDPRTGAPISGEVLKQALATGHEQFDYLVKDQNQQRENLKAQATQMIAGPGNGQPGVTYDQLPPAMKAALGMSAPELMKFSQDTAEGKLTPTNPDVQLKMMDDTYLRSMTDQQFMNTKTQLSGSVWDSFAAHRRTLLSGGGQGPGDLNTPAIKTTVDGLLNQMGINPYPKAAGIGADPQAVSRVAAVHQYVRDAVVTAQQQAGKKFNDADTEAAVNKIFSRDVHFKNTLFGGVTGHSSQTMLGMSASDIPGDVADNLRANFKKNGVANPTDGQLLGAYWHGNPR
jgi:soluble lytic murein transglycosylase